MRAVVVGGGVAGPATALALQKVGIETVVLERRTQADAGAGSWFTLAPNGLHALAAVDCLELARTCGVPTRRNLMRGATGRELGSLSLGRPLTDGTVALTMRRADLAAALLGEAQRRGAEVRRGQGVAAVKSGAGGARAVLDDGKEVEGDLLVGADGVHSVVRRAVDPAAPAARYVGLTNFGGITRGTDLADGSAPETWTFVFGRRAFFGHHLLPGGDVVWFVNVPRPPVGRDERVRTSEHEWKEWLVDRLAGDAGPAAELVRAGRLELAGDNTYDLPHVPTWSRDQMVVLGDAAHAPSPSSGQGASLALEDAVDLGRCLRDAGTVPAALAGFERLRRDRVERVVAAGARSSSAKIPGRVGRVVRDALLRQVFRHLASSGRADWMSDYRPDWSEPVADGLVSPGRPRG